MKHLIIALAACCATPAMSQDLPVRLADGATWTITAERSRHVEGSADVQSWTLTTVKRLTWHAGVNGKPDTLTVTPVSAVAGEGSPAGLAAAQSLAIPATLVVNESLAPGEVVNLDEVRAEFLRLVPSAQGASTDLINAGARAMIAVELGSVSHGQGLGLKLKRPVSADTGIPDPFGGPPLRAIETAELVGFDSRHGRAVVKWRQALDLESFRASTVALLDSVTKAEADPAKIAEARAAFAAASMTSEATCLYEIDIRTGLARRGDCQLDYAVTMKGKSQRVTDHWTISQTEPGPA